jgi:acyl carrier protein
MENIKQILTNIRPAADFNSSHDFIEDGLLDSLDIIKLVSQLDVAFSISIDGEDIIPENFSSFSAIEQLVNKYH